MAHWNYMDDKPSGLPKWATWCSQCDKMFASKITRRKHQWDCHYVCKHPRCHAYLYTEETFLNHVQEDHADVYCKLCDVFLESSRCLEHHMEAEHSYCRKCKVTFSNDEARQEHYLNANPYIHSYCRTCQLDLPDDVSLATHINVCHAPPRSRCRTCKLDLPDDESLAAHNSACHAPPKSDGGPPKPEQEEKNNKRKHQNTRVGSGEEEEEDMPGTPPNHYRTLGVDPSITHKQLLMLIKRRRCKTHPDRFMRRKLSAAQMENVIAIAKNVGWAADILSDRTKRRQHDLMLRAWQRRREEIRKRKKQDV